MTDSTCPVCSGPLTVLAFTATREIHWCDSCRRTIVFDVEPKQTLLEILSADDPRDLTLDPDPTPDNRRAVSASIWFGRDDPVRIGRSRMLVDCGSRRGYGPITEQEHKAEQALRGLTIDRQPWHSDGLTARERAIEAVMIGDHENHGRKRILRQPKDNGGRVHGDARVEWQSLSAEAAVNRDFLIQGGWHVERVPTGNPNGRPPASPPSESKQRSTVEWLEQEVGVPIATIRASVGKGKRSAVRDALEKAVRRSTTSSTEFAYVLGCHRSTVARWRPNATRTPTKRETAPQAEPVNSDASNEILTGLLESATTPTRLKFEQGCGPYQPATRANDRVES